MENVMLIAIATAATRCLASTGFTGSLLVKLIRPTGGHPRARPIAVRRYVLASLVSYIHKQNERQAATPRPTARLRGRGAARKLFARRRGDLGNAQRGESPDPCTRAHARHCALPAQRASRLADGGGPAFRRSRRRGAA